MLLELAGHAVLHCTVRHGLASPAQQKRLLKGASHSSPSCTSASEVAKGEMPDAQPEESTAQADLDALLDGKLAHMLLQDANNVLPPSNCICRRTQ